MSITNLKLFLEVILLFILFPKYLTKHLAECPSNFLQVHNKCYYFSSYKLTWQDSFWRCNELNSTLGIIPNKKQDHKLRSYLWSGFLVPSEWWLGGSYDWKQKKWKWAASGQTINYEKFKEQYKYSDVPRWHCLILDPASQYQWNSKQCTEKHRFICQIKLDPRNHNKDYQSNELPLISPLFQKSENDIGNLLQNTNNQTKKNQAAHTLKNKVHKKSRNTTNQLRFHCPRGYRHVRKVCYKFSRDSATWQDAYYSCESDNGTLAIVHNKRQDMALRKAADRMGVSRVQRWLGGRYDWEELAWKWAASGVVIQHQGNNSELLRWHCLIWDPSEPERWISGSCLEKKHYICQTKAIKVIGQTTMYKPNTKSLKKNIAHLDYRVEMRYNISTPYSNTIIN